MNQLAIDLNKTLESTAALKLLSKKGLNGYFPSKGILGQSAQARGKKINATIGTAFEEDGSPLTLECLEDLISLPSQSFLYAPSPGNPALREEWKNLLIKKNPNLEGKAYSLPVVSSALTHALFITGQLFVDQGDEIIIPDLYWDNYDLIFCEAYGAKFKTYNTFVDGKYDIKSLSAALNNGKIGKKIILLNFPNNPTGYTVTEDEAVKIVAEIKAAADAGNKVLVLLDDAYFGLVYEDGIAKESLFTTLADIHENVLTVKLDGPTKEDYVWGFRVGFITFGFKGATEAQLKAIEAKAGGAVRGSISTAPSISQAMLLKGYQNENYAAQKKTKHEILQRRYDKIVNILDTKPEYKDSFEVMPFNSGYFMCVKPLGVAAEDVRIKLLEDFDTGVVVLSGLVRLAFSATPHDLLEELFENIHQATQALQK